MSPTVLAKTLYSAFSDSVSPSDRLCDYTGIWDSRHVGWADTVGSKTVAMFEGFGLSAMQRLI